QARGGLAAERRRGRQERLHEVHPRLAPLRSPHLKDERGQRIEYSRSDGRERGGNRQAGLRRAQGRRVFAPFGPAFAWIGGQHVRAPAVRTDTAFLLGRGRGRSRMV